MDYWITGVVTFSNGRINMLQGGRVGGSAGATTVSLDMKVPFFPGEGALDIIGTKKPVFDPGEIPRITDAYQMLETLAERLETLKK